MSRSLQDRQQQFARLALWAAAQHFTSSYRGYRSATRLWNWADCQTDCEIYFELLAIACPWFYRDPSNHNTAQFVYELATEYETAVKSWEPQVIADNSGKWAGNALRFADKVDAEQWVRDLSMRWCAVIDTRVVGSPDEPNRCKGGAA